MKTASLCLLLPFALGACASLSSPSPERLAALPVVTYPDKPSVRDYVYRLPAGRDIDMRMRVDGSALASGVDRTLSGRLNHDLYLHKGWASEDGQHWQRADHLIRVHLTMVLPSYEKPGPGEMHITIDRKAAP